MKTKTLNKHRTYFQRMSADNASVSVVSSVVSSEVSSEVSSIVTSEVSSKVSSKVLSEVTSVVTSESMKTAQPRRRSQRRVERTLGLRDRVSSDMRWEGMSAIKELGKGLEPWDDGGGQRKKTQLGPFWSYLTIPPPHKCMLARLIKFYSEEANLRQLCELVERQKAENPPMRLLDWLVTNFSKDKAVVIEIRDREDRLLKIVNVHSEYKRQRGECKKRLFDCFAKRHRICYDLDGRIFTTTVAQANFIHWAITNKVIDYARMFKAEINAHMNEMKSKRAVEKKTGVVQKQRSALSRRRSADVLVFASDDGAPAPRPSKLARLDPSADATSTVDTSTGDTSTADMSNADTSPADTSFAAEEDFDCDDSPDEEM